MGATPDEIAELDREDAEEREIVRPPDLNQDTNRSATRLELFFDLAFVLFVARCADLLAKDETWVGGLTFAAVVAVGWWAWASSALYANRFDTDDAVFRLLMLVGMAAVIGMAASIDELGGAWFTLSYVLLRFVLVAGYLRAWWHVPDARPTMRPYLIGHTAGAAFWLVSLAVPGPAKYVLWGVGVAVDLLGPTLSARLEDALPLHMEHLPERFGLFVILVLGESVAAAVTGVHDGAWKGGVVVTAVFAFVATAALWWSYFDLSGGAAKRRLLEEGHDRTRQGVHDFYVYAHLPVAISLAAVAVGLEHAILHGAEDHLSAGTRGVLAAGVAGYLFSATVIQAGLSRQVRPALLWPGLGVPLALGLLLADLRPPVLLAFLAVLLVAGVATGVAQHHAGEIRTART
ncbi:low temperature requirement protein LtrA [Actinoplanes tereljensis]|nr:low temperature requirement protein A [Actinoplanes tereljensis]